MENKHTPWTVTKYGYEKYSVNGVNGVEVCSTYSEYHARLIAAAPELLEALELVVKRCGPHSSDGAIALAAIAKARGNA